MNAASLLNFFIEKKIIKLKKNELKKISNEIGSDVILGIKPSSAILLSNGDIKKYKNKIKFHILVTNLILDVLQNIFIQKLIHFPNLNLTLLNRNYLKQNI